MPYLYSSKERERDSFKLPDIEVFYVVTGRPVGEFESLARGWYWWACCPGCLPDGEPQGPYETEAEAIEASQED
jgi:hypothetical protein